MPISTLSSPVRTVNAAAVLLGTSLLLFVIASSVVGQSAQQTAVRVSAVATNSPPTITFSWPLDATATSYTVIRRFHGSNNWGASQAVPGGGTATGYVDSTVVVGTRYEYWFSKIGNPSGRGFISTGVDIPPVHSRGKLVLIVDSTKITSLGSRLDRLISDLIGDGWTVLRHDVLPTQAVTAIKALIVANYVADPVNVKSVLLLGRIPVPYSGAIAPDGHPDHAGAWPADVYYGEMNGLWTDSSINTTSATRLENRNVPGDGKFDQSLIPNDIELGVGRVDFANMPAFGASEQTLLQNYLDKNHDYRHKVIVAAEQAVIDDNFGYFGGEAFAATGWRNFSALLGSANVAAADYFTTLNTTTGPGYLWSYGCGGGNYQGAGGIGSTSDFVNSTNRGIFTILFGSYFGDWDSQNNFLRAPLCTGWTLTNFWAGRPHWSVHQMGMGDTIGACARFSQNDTSAGGSSSRFIHIALMGDPSLRQHVIAPPTGLSVVANGSSFTLSWTAPTNPVDGYFVYRSSTPSGPFTLLNPTLVTSLDYTDLTPSTQVHTYMVRATNMAPSSSGTYRNLSQGAFVETCPVTSALAQSIGTSCGTNPPTLSGVPPVIGQTFTLDISNAQPGAAGQIYLGRLGVPVSLGNGCDVQLALNSLSLFLPFVTDASGAFDFSTPLPNDPSLTCVMADFQAIVFETAGFALTNALHLRIGY